MSRTQNPYCLDANTLIQPWNNYYAPSFCPDYWDLLNQLGKEGRIFIPSVVADEIHEVSDELSKWLKLSTIPIHPITTDISECLKKIYAADVAHSFLVSENGLHSAADPWVIAHAIHANGIVVTKELRDIYTKPTKIKIPHVCDNMGVKWINDFQFINELKIKFSCSL